MKEEMAGQKAREAAGHKLERIISRYGDAGGERRQPYYMQQLVEEAKTQEAWHVVGTVCMDVDPGKGRAPDVTDTGAS
jgi:hypothetical protein